MPSEVEALKENSRGLRGSIEETLNNPESTHFSHDDYQILKFHGSYQQDNRDLRNQLKAEGKDKAWSFMIRTKTPGGVVTAKQYLDMDRLCEDLGNQTMRLTTRQGIQFHGILLGDFKTCIQRIHASGITTLGACGDVVRNTLACSLPVQKPVYVEVQKLARQLSDTFLPRTRSYTQIWINGEPFDGKVDDEPIYGKHYLPRKFKIAIAVPPCNDVDVYTNDIGLIAVHEHGQLEGYSIVVGGGLGMSHGMQKTYPVLAKPLFFVKKEHALDAALAIVTMQRDHGNRDDRKLSRLKYVVENKGIDWVRKEVESRMKAPVEPFREVTFNSVSDWLGWHEQGDGKFFYGVFIDNGRIQDTDKIKYRTAIRTVAEKLGCEIRFTANCNLYFCDVDASKKADVDAILLQNGLPIPDRMTVAHQMSHACVALPTCGLALSESERVFTSVMDRIDEILIELKLEKEPILFRMSGCPNGCPRPYNADFAFVGRAPNKYAFFVGGSSVGDRLAGLEKKMITQDDIPAVVRAYLEEFARNRTEGERFTHYWGRVKQTGPVPVPEQFHVEFSAREQRLASKS